MSNRFERLHCPMSYTTYKFQPEVGEFTACCDTKGYTFDEDAFNLLGAEYFTKFPKLMERKQALYDNVKHSDCNTCWGKEERGITSMRQHQATASKLFGNRQIPIDTAIPERIELWMNSTCNLGCFMCHTGNSNTLRKIWYKDKDTHGNNGLGYESWTGGSDYYKGHYRQEFTERMLKFIETAIQESEISLSICYLGGEPTLQDEMYDNVERFIAASKKNKHPNKVKFLIEITTNGTSKDKLNERVYKMFSQYKAAGWRTRVMLSQDATDEQVNIRHGADFEQIKHNFGNWIRSDSVIDEVRSFTVISSFNLPYIDNMAEYIDKTIRANFSDLDKNVSTLQIGFNALQDPKWMQTTFLPKKYAVEKIERAIVIFDKLDADFKSIAFERDYFKNISSNLPDELTVDQVKFLFDNVNYVNSVYKKTYPEWDFYKTFPHLDAMRIEYGVNNE